MKQGYFLSIIILVVISMIFSSCSVNKKDISINNEDAREMALSYLNEKYGEEFIVIGENQMHDSMLGGKVWYRGNIIKKSDEHNDNAHTYEVNVSYNNGEYEIAGDTVIFSYIQHAAKEYLTPIIDKNISNLNYELVITRSNFSNTDYGFPTDIQIPEDDDLNTILVECQPISFTVLISLSNETNMLNSISQSIRNDIDELTVDFSNCYIAIIKDEDFTEIDTYDDSYVQYVQKGNYYHVNLYDII